MELTMKEFDKVLKCKKRKNNKVAKKNKDRKVQMKSYMPVIV
jgi:hypothetical protein